MRAHLLFLVLVLAAAPTHAVEAREKAMMSANPIRKIVTLLQNMEKKIEEQGKKDEELFDKFMCYCKSGRGALEQSVADAKTSIADLGSSIEGAVGKKTQMDEDLKQHKADREAAKASMADATAKRHEEAAAFKAEFEESQADVSGLQKAMDAIVKGAGGSFLQTGAGATLKKIVSANKDMLESDRDEVMSFLSGGAESAAPSDEIIGILKQMKDEMAKGLAEAEAAEADAIKAYEGLIMAKTKEVESLSAMIETKLTRTGELAVEIAEMKNELGDTQESLAADEKFLDGLEENCALKQKEWAGIQKTRAEELLAIADAIKMLNDDDALELFKKTLPGASASFVQIQVSSKAMRARALDIVGEARRAAGPFGRRQLDFISLALHGKKVGFEKVIKLIDDMCVTLKAEQKDDDTKKEYCEKEFDTSDDKKKELERSIADTETAIAETEDGIARLGEDIEALDDGIRALDKSVAEATEQRKEENEDYVEFMAGNGAAKELLGLVKNRLNKFYNPKMYKAPPKRELTEEEQATLAAGGTLAPTAAPGGIAGTGVAVFVQVRAHTQKEAPGAPPAAPGGEYKKSEESGGVMAMIDMMVQDLDKEMTEGEAEEKNSQADYETMMQDSAAKRATDSKSLTDKAAAKADSEEALGEHNAAKASSTKELGATNAYIASLHGDCDFLLQYFDARKEARASEVDAMQKAKAVLSGADYSLVQTGSSSKVVKFLGRA